MGFFDLFKKDEDNNNNENEFTCAVCGKTGNIKDYTTCICHGKKHKSSVYVHGACFNRARGLCDDCINTDIRDL